MFFNNNIRKCLKLVSGWFEINLDQRKLRTPGGNLFRVPHEALAMAVATEWNAQEQIIKRHTMHLVRPEFFLLVDLWEFLFQI